MTRRQLIAGARALSRYTGMPLSKAYVIVWRRASEQGKAPPNNFQHYLKTVWDGDRDAFEAALMECLGLWEANPEDPTTMAEMWKLMRATQYQELPSRSAFGDAPAEAEPREGDLRLPSAA